MKYDLENEKKWKKMKIGIFRKEMKEWKNSKDFFGRTDKPKPVEPVKPKKKR